MRVDDNAYRLGTLHRISFRGIPVESLYFRNTRYSLACMLVSGSFVPRNPV